MTDIDFDTVWDEYLDYCCWQDSFNAEKMKFQDYCEMMDYPVFEMGE